MSVCKIKKGHVSLFRLLCLCVREPAHSGACLLEKGDSRVCVNGCAYGICV